MLVFRPGHSSVLVVRASFPAVQPLLEYEVLQLQVVPAATPSTPDRAWALGAALLLAGIALVVAWTAASHSEGNIFTTAPAIELPGNAFAPVRGAGHKSGPAFVLESLDASHLAVLSSRVEPFHADDYHRITIKLHSANIDSPAPPVADIMLVWRTAERPGRNFSKPLSWSGAQPTPIEMRSADGWVGSITGIALAVRGELPHPLVLEALSIQDMSATTATTDIVTQWAAFMPFVATSITAPFDQERMHLLPLLPAVAFAIAFACLVYRAARRGKPLDSRVLWAICIGGWLILDARWQVNLWRQLAQTATQYAGKTDEQKHLAASDFEVYALMRQVNAALPAPPVRIHLLADSLALRTRAAFFLYPHNVYHDLAEKVRVAPVPENLRSGDYVVSLLYGGLVYDHAQQALVWPDGQRRAVDEILFKPGGPLVVRIK